jgi:hypothetical protein
MWKKVVLCVFSFNVLASSNIKMTQIVNGVTLDNEYSIFPHKISAHAYSIVTTTAICAYIGTALYALHARYLLNDMNAWNNWKNNIPLSDLASMPQKDISALLTKGIQAHYHCPQGTLIMNIPHFLNDTSNEIDTLITYKTIGTFLQSFYIAPLVFMTKDSIAQAEEKIKRLHFLQTVIANDLEPQDMVR